MPTASRSPVARSTTATLQARSRARYSSVLESALVGLGREDAVVQSARKPRQKHPIRPVNSEHSPIRSLQGVVESSNELQQDQDGEEDPFAQLKLKKTHKHSHKKRRERLEVDHGDESPAVTRSATKSKRRHTGVLEVLTRTPLTRSKTKEKHWRRNLEIRDEDDRSFFEPEPEDDDDVVIQKKLFQSPEPKRKVKSESEMWEKKRRKEGKYESWEKPSPFKPQKTDETRVYRKAVELEQWSVVWPIALVSGGEKKSSGVRRVQLVLIGQVHGASECFMVGKRLGPKRFTSSEGEYLSLSGRFDEEAARTAGMPREARELMKDGIPSFFQKKLRQFVLKSQDATKRSKVAPKSKVARKQWSSSKRDRSNLKVESEAESVLKTPTKTIATAFPTTPGQDDAFETPNPKKRVHPKETKTKMKAKKKKKITKKEESELETEEDIWTPEQLEALSEAKLQIPTTASNFWAQVAQFVQGKTAKECQKKTFAQFKSPPTNRKPAKKAVKQVTKEATVPSKIARAGSNKFKKQVREFVEEYEQKHVDDLFDTTPSKEGLPELPDFDALKSPELGTSRSFDEDDSDLDDEAPGLLKKLSSRKRDDIDSYVLGINRQHVAGGGVMKGGKVRRITTMVSPVSTAKTKSMSAKKKAVLLEEECGSHFLKGVVSPGGTTHVRVEKDGSSSEDENEDEYYSSEEEEDYDIL